MKLPKTFRSRQNYELVILIAVTAVAAFLFRNSRLDLLAASAFYHPENSQDPWFEQTYFLWDFFYFAAPWLTGALLFGAFTTLLRVQFRSYAGANSIALGRRRLGALFVFLVILCGSGVVINTILKPYWGRPRPREVIELGGKATYRPFYSPDFGARGKSFPCGHCSVGFSFGLFWWILRERKPKLAALSLGSSMALGGLMGWGRMAAGGHFLSDVVAAALIVYWICFGIYYYGLKVPKRIQNLEQDSAHDLMRGQAQAPMKPWIVAAYSGLGTLTLLALLLASPFHQDYDIGQHETATEAELASFGPKGRFELQIDRSQVQLRLDRKLRAPFHVRGEAQGFAFPGSKVAIDCDEDRSRDLPGQPNLLLCKIAKQGLYSDFESQIWVTVNPDLMESFRLELFEGEVYRDPVTGPILEPLPNHWEVIEQARH